MGCICHVKALKTNHKCDTIQKMSIMGQAGGLQSQYFVVVFFLFFSFFFIIFRNSLFGKDLISPLSHYFLLFIIIELSVKL